MSFVLYGERSQALGLKVLCLCLGRFGGKHVILQELGLAENSLMFVWDGILNPVV